MIIIQQRLRPHKINWDLAQDLLRSHKINGSDIDIDIDIWREYWDSKDDGVDDIFDDINQVKASLRDARRRISLHGAQIRY